MSALLGVTFAAGVLLILAPRLWPRRGGHERRPPRASRFRLLLDGAGFDQVSPGAFVVVSFVLALTIGGLLLGLTGIAALAVLGACAGGGVPTAVARWRISARRSRRRRSWPDLIDHLTAAIRSGVALPEALAGLAQVGPDDLRPAFDEFARVYRATGRFGTAVDHLKARLADPIADRIMETLRMAREVGGSELTTVLRGLAQHLRSETAVRDELLARQSWVANSARLGVAAPWIVLLLLSTRPETAAAFSTPGGVLLLICGAVLSVVAYRVMLRIGRLPVEQRVFG